MQPQNLSFRLRCADKAKRLDWMNPMAPSMGGLDKALGAMAVAIALYGTVAVVRGLEGREGWMVERDLVLRPLGVISAEKRGRQRKGRLSFFIRGGKMEPRRSRAGATKARLDIVNRMMFFRKDYQSEVDWRELTQ